MCQYSSIFFAKLSTIIYLTNQVMIPESGITRRQHSKNVHRLPFFLSRPHTTLSSPIFYFALYPTWEPACSQANCNESICTFGTLQCALPHLGVPPGVELKLENKKHNLNVRRMQVFYVYSLQLIVSHNKIVTVLLLNKDFLITSLQCMSL